MAIVVDIWRPTDQTRASRTTSINRKRKQLLITVGCQLAWDAIRRVYVSAASAQFCLHRSPDVATQLRQPATDPDSSVSSGDVPWESQNQNQINIRLIGKIPQLTQTQMWFASFQSYLMGEEQNKRQDKMNINNRPNADN